MWKVKKARNEVGDYWCPACESFKPEKEFNKLSLIRKKNRKTTTPVQTWCRLCANAKHMKIRSNPNYALKEMVAKAQARAQKDNRDFDLPTDWAIKQLELQKSLCYYTGLIMTFDVGKGRVYTRVSIDRINNYKGYTQDNCVLCCSGFNTMKMDLTLSDFRLMCKNFLFLHPDDLPLVPLNQNLKDKDGI